METSHGQSVSQSSSTGPFQQEWRDGWLIRTASHWDHTEPGIPA